MNNEQPNWLEQRISKGEWTQYGKMEWYFLKAKAKSQERQEEQVSGAGGWWMQAFVNSFPPIKHTD